MLLCSTWFRALGSYFSVTPHAVALLLHLIYGPGLFSVTPHAVTLLLHLIYGPGPLIHSGPALSLHQILGTLGVLATFFWLLFTPMNYNLPAPEQIQLQKKRLGEWSCDCHVINM